MGGGQWVSLQVYLSPCWVPFCMVVHVDGQALCFCHGLRCGAYVICCYGFFCCGIAWNVKQGRRAPPCHMCSGVLGFQGSCPCTSLNKHLVCMALVREVFEEMQADTVHRAVAVGSSGQWCSSRSSGN